MRTGLRVCESETYYDVLKAISTKVILWWSLLVVGLGCGDEMSFQVVVRCLAVAGVTKQNDNSEILYSLADMPH